VNKEVRKAVNRAESDPGFDVTELHGHNWGQITCTGCGARIKVYSSGRTPEKGAQLIHKFLDKHAGH
jgi:hypothetical protein